MKNRRAKSGRPSRLKSSVPAVVPYYPSLIKWNKSTLEFTPPSDMAVKQAQFAARK